MQQLYEKLKDSVRTEIEKSRNGESAHNTEQLRHILNELEIPEHIACLLRNLYAGQEATVRT